MNDLLSTLISIRDIHPDLSEINGWAATKHVMTPSSNCLSNRPAVPTQPKEPRNRSHFRARTIHRVRKPSHSNPPEKQLGRTSVMNPVKSPRTRFRASILAVAAVAVCLVVTGCGSDKADIATASETTAALETAAPPETAAAPDTAAAETEASTAVAAPAETGSVFVGAIPEIIHGVVGVHLSEPDSNGKRVARVYVCDGKPTDDGGFALWFKGDIAEAGETTLTAAGRTETVTFAVGDSVSGTVKFDEGTVHKFDAPPAVKGSGIYDITIGAGNSYDGRSTVGDVLSVSFTGDPLTASGSLTLRDGTAVPIEGTKISDRVQWFGRSYERDRPISESFVPGKFVAVIWAKHGGHLVMSGRDGDVRTGLPGRNIIGVCSFL